ncbi:MAG: NAD(P)-binding domain-containing protein [bacterium]
MWGFFEKKPIFDPSVLTYLVMDENLQTNVKGIYLAGDLSGYPLIKTAINQAHDLVERLSSDMPKAPNPDVHDLVIIGAGAAGLEAAMTAHKKGLRYVLLEAERPGNTIFNFPLGKMLFAEPLDEPLKGHLWLKECSREEILKRWNKQIEEIKLNIKTAKKVTAITRTTEGIIETATADGEIFRSMRAILSIGKQGNPRKLKAPGEEMDKVSGKLYDPAGYEGKKILIIGGGDAAAETTLALCDNNEVTHAMIEPGLIRPKARNVAKLQAKEKDGKIKFFFNTTVKEIHQDSVVLNTKQGEKAVENEFVFVNIGAEMPWGFLKKAGLKIANEWTARRRAFFIAFLLFITAFFLFKAFGKKALYDFYGISLTDISYPLLGFIAKWWYGILYTGAVLCFGGYILSGPRRRHFRLHNYVRWRTVSCMFFQTVFLFALPLIPAKYLGSKAATLITVWPLTLMPAGFVNRAAVMGNAQPEIVFYAIFTVVLAFMITPVFVYFHGKRYCSWVCGCGALAETLGEPFRHLSPKGYLNRRRERVIYILLAASVVMTAILVLRELTFSDTSIKAISFWYNLVVYLIFSGIIGLGLYPFYGNRMWCRYLCPLAAYLNLLGAVWSRYKISSNDRCIDCGQCNRYCEMGIDVKGFALQRKSFSVRNTPCIGCGECIAVCPMNVLGFGEWDTKETKTGYRQKR